jgi:hypothetical protein
MPMMEIKIQAQSESPDLIFGWTPEQADFDEVLIGKKAKFNVDVTNNDSVDAKLIVVGEPTMEYVKKYKIKNDNLKPGESTPIEIELQKDIAPGAFKTALTIEADGRPDTRFTIPITGRVVEKLTEKPSIADKVTNPSAKKVVDKTETKSGGK